MDLGKFLRDRKKDVVKRWQNSTVLDAVSANTQADQARRVAQGAPQQYQGNKFAQGLTNFVGANKMQDTSAQDKLDDQTFKSDLSKIVSLRTSGQITPEQARGKALNAAPTGNTDYTKDVLNNQANRSGIGQAVLPALGTFSKPFATGLSDIGTAVGTGVEAFTPFNGVGKNIQEASKRQSQGIDDLYKASSFNGGQKGENRLVTGVSSGLGSLASSLATGATKGLTTGAGRTLLNPTTMSGLQFGLSAGAGQMRDATDNGKSAGRAFGTGLVAGGVEAGLEKVGLDKYLGAGGNFARRTGTRMLTEGLQEGSQSLAQSLVSGTFKHVNPVDAIKQAALEGGMGGLVGGIGGVGGDIALNLQERQDTQAPSEVKQQVVQSKPVLQQTGIPAQPGSIRERIQVAKENVTNKIASSIAPLDQMGRIPNPTYRAPFTQGEPGAELLNIQNPLGANQGIPITNELGATIRTPLRTNTGSTLVEPTVPIQPELKITDANNQSTFIDPTKLRGVARQSYESKRGVLNQSGSVQIPKVLTNISERIRNSSLAKNEGGYAKNPFYDKKNDIAQDLTPEQSDFINNYANMLEDMGSGNGVTVNPETNQRVSSNYRNPELGSGKVSKAEWFDQARKELESGKGAYGASEEYKALAKKEVKKPAVRERPQTTDNDFQNTLPSATRPNSIKEIVKSGGNPLYHDTTANGVLGILESGEIQTSQAPFSSIAGQGKRVSTTRNFDNYSRYGKAPYRLVIDESLTGQKAKPDNREEFESIFKNNVSTKAVKSLAIDITNPAILNDIRNGTVEKVIAQAKSKGINVETFEGKLLPDIYSNKEVQEMTKNAYNKAFPTQKSSSKTKSPKPPVQDLPSISTRIAESKIKTNQSLQQEALQLQKQQKDQALSTRKAPEKEQVPKTTKQKSQQPQDKSKTSVKTSLDGRITNIDEYVKQQVSEQEAKPDKSGRISRLKRTWIDTLSPAEDNFRQAVKDGKLSQETLDEIVVKNGKSIRSGTAANLNLIESGLVDLLHSKSKTDYDNLGQTLIAIHSNDLRANGIETGRSPQVDSELISKYGKQFESEIKQFKDATNYVLDKSVKSQLISKETADMLKKKYPNYVPMNRVIEELENSGSFGKSQVASIGKQTVVQRIKGSKRTVENPMESMIAKVQDMTAQSLRNEAALSWVDALKQTGDATLVKGTVKPGESTISVIRNGEKEIYSVEPEMEAAAKGLTKEQMGTLTNAARKISRVFKTGTTGLNLPFIVTNLARDQQNALLNQNKGEFETFRAIPTAIMETLGHGDLYKEAVRNGAVSTSFDLTKPNLKLTAEHIRKKGSKLGTLDKIEDVIGRSEEYTRIQQYKATKEYWLKKGMGETEAQNKATIAAQQNSADFARSGDLGAILNAWLPYTNAGVQGTRSTLRAARNNPTRYAIKAGAMLVMPAIMTALWNTADEERKKIYDDISENDKQASFVVVTPWATKNEEGKWEGILKIPKPPGISALMYPIEKATASMKGSDPVEFKDLVKGVLGFASPLGDNLNAAVSTVTPQVLKPAAESIINKNIFTGRDIVPSRMKNKTPSEQVYEGSSGTARFIGKATNISPIKIEHMIRGYGGELGLQALNASDNALAKVGAIPEEQIGGISVPQGFKKRFTEAYDKPQSTIPKNGESKATASNTDDFQSLATAAFNDKQGKEFMALKSDDERKEYARQSSDNRKLYDQYQALKKRVNGGDQLLAPGLDEDSTKTLNKLDRMMPKAKDAYLSKNNTAEYEYELAKYNNKKANGEINLIDEINTQQKLNKLKATKDFEKGYRDIYSGLSKSEVYGLITSNENGKKIADQLLAIDDALVKAGNKSKFRDKYGNVDFNPARAKGGKGSRGGKKSDGTLAANSLTTDTLQKLNALLSGTQKPVTGYKKAVGGKVALKKITVKK